MNEHFNSLVSDLEAAIIKIRLNWYGGNWQDMSIAATMAASIALLIAADAHHLAIQPPQQPETTTEQEQQREQQTPAPEPTVVMAHWDTREVW